MSQNRIRVTKCEDCPFLHYGQGSDYCYFDSSINNDCGDQLPQDRVPQNCPLKKGPVVVEVDHE